MNLRPLATFTCAASLLAGATLTLNPAKWDSFLFWMQKTQFPLFTDAGALAFDFPGWDTTRNRQQYLDYILTRTRGISGTVIVNLQVSATPGTVFEYQSEPGNTCSSPAQVRPYFEASGGARWWANPTSYVLADGSATISVPLIPGMWSNVNGQMGDSSQALIDQFYQDLPHATVMGLSFGGGCFFGHGVGVSNGSARFRLLGYSIQ